MDKRVVLILSLVVAFTGIIMVVTAHSRANNVIDLSVAQPSGVQQAANPDSAKKDPTRLRLNFQSRRKVPSPPTFR